MTTPKEKRPKPPTPLPWRRRAEEIAEEREHLRETITPFSARDNVPEKLPRAALTFEGAGRATAGTLFDPEAQDQGPLTQSQQRNLWKQVFTDEKLTLAQTEMSRVRVVYRLIRELAKVRGLLTDGEQLASLSEDAWTAPNTSFTTAKPFFSRHWKLAEVLNEANELPPSLGGPGLPLVPPDIPPEQRGNADYNPCLRTHDPGLHLYIEALQRIAEYLGVERGAKFDKSLGRHGLVGLLRPNLIRLVFPSVVDQLVPFEKLLISQTLDTFVMDGQNDAEMQLRDRYGFDDGEIIRTIQLMRDYAVEKTHSEVEQDRALMRLRLHDIIKRAKEAMDLRVEMYAYKMLGIVEGLNKVEPEDALSEFTRIIGRVSQEKNDDRKIIELKPLKQIGTA